MAQEEEVLGKAYDSRLMKRLLQYLRPYKWQTTIALGSILLKVGAEPVGGSPEFFDKLIQSDHEKWGPVIKAAGIKGD